jgi:hypothetical protein
MVGSMNTHLRTMFWVLSLATSFVVIFSGYFIEKPLAVTWPVETVAIWGSVLALGFAICLFFTMPSTPNGRKGLLVAFGFVGFAVWSSFQALEQTSFLYRRVEMFVNIETDNQETGEQTSVRVGGELYMPRNRYELPVALLMPDSSENSYKRNVFYAKALARRGVAAVAYGRSTAYEPTLLAPVNIEQRAEDVIYMLDLIDRVTEIYMRRAGLVGFYENEWVIPFTLQKTNRVNYGVLMAPSGITPAERAVAFLDRDLRSEGLAPEEIERARSLVRDLAESLRTGDIGMKRTELIQRWEEAKDEPWFAAAGFPDEPPQAGTTGALSTAIGFDPRQLWGATRSPIQIYVGSEDPQSLPETLRERFGIYFGDNKEGTWEMDVVLDANHMMLLDKDSFSMGASFPPGFFDRFAEWVIANTPVP